MIQYLSMLFGVYDRIISFVSCLGRKNPFSSPGQGCKDLEKVLQRPGQGEDPGQEKVE